MASLLLGALPIASQSLGLGSRISFSQSETLASPFSSSTASISISAPTSPPSIPLGTCNSAYYNSLSYIYVCIYTLIIPILLVSVYCGRGDKKTERGKRFNHSFGNVSNCYLSFFFFFSLIMTLFIIFSVMNFVLIFL